MLEKIVEKAQLCANMRIQIKNKLKESKRALLAGVNGPTGAGKNQQINLSNKRLPKNNSFDEKNMQSDS